tara:strand:+ start:188 stop:421 length:234 start_codon:yes stop_codon:yes gene_type:complete
MVKNRTPEEAKLHNEYMKNYYKNNEKQRIKNYKASSKRALVKIPCPECTKLITRGNMKRHIKVKHLKPTPEPETNSA